MKKFLAIVITLAIIGGIAYWITNKKSEQSFGMSNTLTFDQVIIGSKTTSNVLTYGSFSTTTPTTTKDIAIGPSIDEADLNLCVIASSTSSIVNWYYEFSPDGTNFYGQDADSIASNVITHESATTTHSWTPPGTSLTCKNVSIDGLNANWLRIVFYRITNASAPSTNFYLYAEGKFTDKN